MTVEAETAAQLLARKKVEALVRELYRPVLRAIVQTSRACMLSGARSRIRANDAIAASASPSSMPRSREAGGDPWSVLASARAELDDVHPSQRAWRIVTRFAILHALVVLTVTLAAVFVVG